jgi:hypothetical protein
MERYLVRKKRNVVHVPTPMLHLPIALYVMILNFLETHEIVPELFYLNQGLGITLRNLCACLTVESVAHSGFKNVDPCVRLRCPGGLFLSITFGLKFNAPHLRTLELYSAWPGPTQLPAPRLVELHTLTLMKMNLANMSLDALPNLRTLILRRVKLLKDCALWPRQSHALETLTMTDCLYTDVPDLSQLFCLQHLSLDFDHDLPKEIITTCPAKPQTLQLSYCTCLDELKDKLRNVASLRLTKADLSDFMIPEFIFTSLQHLTLVCNELWTELLEILFACEMPKLSSLFLVANCDEQQGDEDEDRPWQKLPRAMKHLTLACICTPKLLAALCELQELKRVVVIEIEDSCDTSNLPFKIDCDQFIEFDPFSQ